MIVNPDDPEWIQTFAQDFPQAAANPLPSGGNVDLPPPA